MSFVLQALRSKPIALHTISDTTPFDDHSGYQNNATGPGLNEHAAFVSGTYRSRVFNADQKLTVSSNVFVKGKESQSFSLEAWVRTIGDSTAKHQILGHLDTGDGIEVEGTVVRFVLKYEDGSSIVASHDMQQHQVLHIVGTKSDNKISLYINGQLKDETSVVSNSKYSTAQTALSGGQSTNAAGVAISCIGVYSATLESSQVLNNYNAGKIENYEDVVSMFQGDLTRLSIDESSVFLDQYWSTEEEWGAGVFSNMAVLNDRLVPEIVNNVSVAGSWKTSFALDSSQSATIDAVQLAWDGIGSEVSVSLDGTNWEIAERYKNISLVPSGFVVAQKELQIRVAFASGVSTESFLDNLNVIGVVSKNIVEDDKSLTYTSGYSQRNKNTCELHEDWGAQISSGGNARLRLFDLTNQRTLEFWVKPETNRNVNISNLSGTTYRNGEAFSGNLVAGTWNLIHITTTSDINDVTISGPCQIGYIATYDGAMSASKIMEAYNAYMGLNVTRTTDNLVNLVQNNSETRVYGYEWSVQGAV